LSSAVDQIFVTPAMRAEGRAAAADFVRNLRRGRRVVDAGIADAIERELLAWAKPRLQAALSPWLDERRVGEHVARHVAAAREAWEQELVRAINAQESDLFRRGVSDRPLSFLRVLVESPPEPVPEASAPRMVARFLQVETEPGFGEGEGRNGSEPYATPRKPLEERGPAAGPDYKRLYSQQVYGEHASEFS